MATRNKHKQQPRATGEVWIVKDEEPVTVPVPVPVVMVKVDGPFTEHDRKLWTFLLHAVWDQLPKERWHTLSVSDISRVFRDIRGRNGTAWIWDSFERLVDTKVRFEKVEGDSRYRGIANIISAVGLLEEGKKEGQLRFEFPAMLIDAIKEPYKFARLRTHFLIGLSGKYAVTLYELLETVANKRNAVLNASIDDLRHWLKVPEGKLSRWHDLNKRAIEPAIVQINNSSDSGLCVSYEPVLGVRNKVLGVCFTVKKTEQRLHFEKKISRPKNVSGHSIPRFQGRVYEKAKKLAPRLDIYAVEAEWREWLTKRSITPDSFEASFIAFLKKKESTNAYKQR